MLLGALDAKEIFYYNDDWATEKDWLKLSHEIQFTQDRCG